jgi:hypothetical protein
MAGLNQEAKPIPNHKTRFYTNYHWTFVDYILNLIVHFLCGNHQVQSQLFISYRKDKS